MEKISILLGKAADTLTRIKGSGGSALPGLVVEKTDPNFLKRVLSPLPYGVVVVSGTNGKTTTTKLLSALLKSAGLRVFTNATGSNFVRGVISSVLKKIHLNGRFDYDIAVLELDEAHALRFIEFCPVRYALLLNVARDQLDRFAEIDHTSELLAKLARAATHAVVLNRSDPRIANIPKSSLQKGVKLAYFGLAPKLAPLFPSDDALLAQNQQATQESAQDSAKLATAKSTQTTKQTLSPQAGDQPDFTLLSFSPQKATYAFGEQRFSLELKVKGGFNAYNLAAVFATAQLILPHYPIKDFAKAASQIEPAFGRGESLSYRGSALELFLVKNPAAFRASLASLADQKHSYMIAINDCIADGRDVSWLWNVDFSKLESVAMVSGLRAFDMALRLKYDNVKLGQIEPDLKKALQSFCKGSQPKRIFATYTAMLALRKIILGRSIDR